MCTDTQVQDLFCSESVNRCWNGSAYQKIRKYLEHDGYKEGLFIQVGSGDPRGQATTELRSGRTRGQLQEGETVWHSLGRSVAKSVVTHKKGFPNLSPIPVP